MKMVIKLIGIPIMILAGALFIWVTLPRAEDDTFSRQRCYLSGAVHADDQTDPSVVGIPDGACRESYLAGRAYITRLIRESDETALTVCDNPGLSENADCRTIHRLVGR
jgi:hypothetical protein